jgi:histone H4
MSSKGIGQGGSRRHRRVLRDNIQGLKKASMQRMAHKAGVFSLSGMCYEELRGITKVTMESLIKNAIMISRHQKRKTVSLEDMLDAIHHTTGKKFAYTHAHRKIKRC